MKALIVKTSSLGDIIQTFPVAEYLKSVQGIETVGWVVEKSAFSLISSHPFVDIPMCIDTKKLRTAGFVSSFFDFITQRADLKNYSFDLLFDLQGNTKSGLVSFCAKAPTKVGYGKNFVSELPNCFCTNARFDPPLNLPIREEYLSIVQQYFGDTKPFEPSECILRLNENEQVHFAQEKARWPKQRAVWCIAVGSAWPNKMVEKSFFLNILKKCTEHFNPYFIFIAGSALELRQVCEWAHEFSSDSHVVYRPTLPVMQHIMKDATVVISVDSLALHLAATTKTPTFSFFGPSSPSRYLPSGSSHGFFYGPCPLHVSFDKRCPYLRSCQTGECLKKLDIGSVFRSLYEWYKRT